MWCHSVLTSLWMLTQEMPYFCCGHVWNCMMLMISVWFTAHAKRQFLEYIFGAFIQNGTSLLTVIPISSAAIKIMNSKVISETSWVDLTFYICCYHFKMLDVLLSILKIGSDLYILGVGTIWLVRGTGAACACCL